MIDKRINEIKNRIKELDEKYHQCSRTKKPCEKCDNCNSNHEERLNCRYEIRRLENITIPEEYKNAEIESGLLQNVNENRNIWFYGESGTGKTYSCYAYYIYSKINRLEISIIHEKNIIENYEEYQDRDILIIDDIGTELDKFRKEKAYSNYFYLIDYRNSKAKKTIFTSKYDLENWIIQIATVNKELATSIYSRLNTFKYIQKFEGEDKRLKIKDER